MCWVSPADLSASAKARGLEALQISLKLLAEGAARLRRRVRPADVAAVGAVAAVRRQRQLRILQLLQRQQFKDCR